MMAAQLWLRICLAVTLPTALSALIAVRLADPMLKGASGRSAFRSAAIALTFLSMAAPPLWKQLQPNLTMSAQAELDSPVRILAPTHFHETGSTDTSMLLAIVLVWATGAALKLAATGVGLAKAYRNAATSVLLNDKKLCAAVQNNAAEFGLPAPRLVIS